MDWTMNNYNEFVSKVLNHKEDYKGEKMGNYIFAGAGQECIKLENENEIVFISYEEVLNEETETAKAVFDFFFNEENESEENSSDSESIEDNDENWMYYKLIHHENKEVELFCCIDTNTVDDDIPDCEWMWCDGIWRKQVPHYWSVDNYEVTPLLEELISVSAREWGFISQALVDWEDTVDEVYVHEFKNCTLLVSYDDSFDEYYLSSKKSTIQIDGWVKKELDGLKIHQRQSYNEVIKSLLRGNYNESTYD